MKQEGPRRPWCVAGGALGEGRLLGRLHFVLSPKVDAIAGIWWLQAAPTQRGMA